MQVTTAEELYILPPAEFTAARNRRAKEAKTAGDKALGDEIARLPKPSVAAWAVNLLSQQRGDILAQVIELGQALRDAQEDLDREKLKELSRRRQELLRSVAAQGAELAAGAGHKLPAQAAAEVEQTLQAAMADAGAADAVRSGRLTRTLSSTGIEPVDLSGAVAVADVPPPPLPDRDGAAAPRSRLSPAAGAFERRRDEARRQLQAAEAEAGHARDQLLAAEGRSKAIEPRLGELSRVISDLERRLATARAELAACEDEAAAADEARRSAERAADEADRAAVDAKRRLDRLGS